MSMKKGYTITFLFIPYKFKGGGCHEYEKKCIWLNFYLYKFKGNPIYFYAK